MKTICVLAFPAHGHIFPLLPLLKILKANYRVVVYGTQSYKDIFEQEGVEFRPYPLNEESFSLKRDHVKMIYDLLALTTHIAPHLMTDPIIKQCDGLVIDGFAYWGKCAAQKLDKKRVIFYGSTLTSTRLRDHIFGSPIDKASRIIDIIGTSFLYALPLLRKLRSINKAYAKPIPDVKDLTVMTKEVKIVSTPLEINNLTEACTQVRSMGFLSPSHREQVTRATSPCMEEIVFISLGTVYCSYERLRKITKVASLSKKPLVVLAREHTERLKKEFPEDTIHIVRSLNQAESLRHISLFITHAGPGGITESIYNEVPMICFPQAVDQYSVANRLLKQKLIQPLRLSDLPQAISESMKKDSKERENIRNLKRKYVEGTTLELLHRTLSKVFD